MHYWSRNSKYCKTRDSSIYTNTIAQFFPNMIHHSRTEIFSSPCPVPSRLHLGALEGEDRIFPQQFGASGQQRPFLSPVRACTGRSPSLSACRVTHGSLISCLPAAGVKAFHQMPLASPLHTSISFAPSKIRPPPRPGVQSIFLPANSPV